MTSRKRPLCLIIMDGLAYGSCGDNPAGDAVVQAKTPVLDGLVARWPHSRLIAHGREVGLPEGQMGNSEVGHLNIGAGSVVYQDLTSIDVAIEDGSFYENKVLQTAIDHVLNTENTLHLMGLLSDGGVHSSIDHLYALIKMAKSRGVENIAIHAFLDGRDTPPKSGIEYLSQLEQFCMDQQAGHVATVIGRYYAMDRDNRWDRVEVAYNALVNREGERFATPQEAITASYAGDITDEFVKPCILTDDAISDGDSVVFFNFRPDRAREITRTLTDAHFSEFPIISLSDLHFVCMTAYDATFALPIAFKKSAPFPVLAGVLANAKLRQIHIAETEKYAHVTFFFNGGVEQPYEGEERILIDSPKVPTYDLKPSMSAVEVADSLIDAIEHDQADVYICNFANGDMVGHTGIVAAAIEAVETVDTQVGRVVESMTANGGVTLITADHGNAEHMIDADGTTPFTAHTCTTVPFIAVNTSAQNALDGALCDIAPTMLNLLDVDVPQNWTGSNLLVY